MSLFLEKNQVEVIAVPIDTNGAAVASDWLSLKAFNRVTFIIQQGAWAGGTPAVTLEQATAVAGTGNKALAFTKKYSKVALTGTVWTEQAVTSNTFNLTATANRMEAIEVVASDLDTSNAFTSVQLKIATPGANADLISVLAILSEPNYAADVVAVADPKVD